LWGEREYALCFEPRHHHFIACSLTSFHNQFAVSFSFPFFYLFFSFLFFFFVCLKDLPRLVVMDMPKEVFYEDVAVDEQDEMETFLRQVHANKIPAQREGYQGTVKRFMAKINDMGWRFYAMMLPLVLSLIAFCISKPADEGLDEMRRRKMAKKSE
jgi:hypothetical protein